MTSIQADLVFETFILYLSVALFYSVFSNDDWFCLPSFIPFLCLFFVFALEVIYFILYVAGLVPGMMMPMMGPNNNMGPGPGGMGGPRGNMAGPGPGHGPGPGRGRGDWSGPRMGHPMGDQNVQGGGRFMGPGGGGFPMNCCIQLSGMPFDFAYRYRLRFVPRDN
jgi:hypothetical protein